MLEVSGVFVLALSVCYLVAALVVVAKFIEVVKARREGVSEPLLWFVGIFTTPITLGIYALICVLEDRR